MTCGAILNQSYKEDGSIANIMAPAELLMEPVDTIFEEASFQIGNHMNWYEDAMTKHTKQIIEDHKDFFENQAAFTIDIDMPDNIH